MLLDVVHNTHQSGWSNRNHGRNSTRNEKKVKRSRSILI